MLKKCLALALCIMMVLSLAACGEEPAKPVEKPDQQDTPPASEVGDKDQPDLETPLWTLSYDESVWTLQEDYFSEEDDYCAATLQIPDPEDPEYYLINVDIYASVGEPYGFREDLVYYGFDQYQYAEENAYEFHKIGGVDCLKYETESWGESVLRYFNRVEGAGATVEVVVNAEDVTDSRVTDLLAGLTFTLEDTGNVDGPWEWEGEPFSAEDKSVTAGGLTIQSEWIPFDEYVSTNETFDHYVAVVGDTVYLLEDDTLSAYTYDGDKLTYQESVELPAEGYSVITATNDGALWLSGFMNDVIVLKDGADVATYAELDDVVMHPSGKWGINYFSESDCRKVTFTADSYTTEDMTFAEVDSIMHMSVSENHIYVCGSAVDESGHKVFVYDTDGNLQMTLCDADGEGLGSITYITETANGFFGFDGNMRNVVLWDAQGNWVAEVEDDQLFSTEYPWFCSSAMLDDGSLLTVMTEERADCSATELVAFRVSGF